MSGLPAQGVRIMLAERIRLGARMCLLCLLVSALTTGAVNRAHAAPAAQNTSDEPPLILLGEYYFQPISAGQTAQLQVHLPQDGTYLLTSDDPDSATQFTLTLFDESGRALHSDIFRPIELELQAARYMLQFQLTEAGDAAETDTTSPRSAASDAVAAAAPTAPRADEALLSFVMLGNLGSMSDDEAAPGRLYNGGFYRASSVDGPRYGLLSIPPSPYPQEVNLTVVPANGDEYFVLAQGDDIDPVSIDTTKTTLLRFWTQGGDYALRVLPVGPASEFTLVPFLSGPPPVLPLGKPERGVLPANTTRVIYQIVLDESLSELSLTLDSNATNIRMKVTQPGVTQPLFASSFGASELTLAELSAGTYYVSVESITPGDADVSYELRAEGVAGTSSGTPTDALTSHTLTSHTLTSHTLTSGTVTTGTLVSDERARLYEFPVTQAGALITATLSGDAAADLRLTVGGAASENVWRSTDVSRNGAPTTTLQTVFIAPIAGAYLAEVRSQTGTGSGRDFALQVQEGGTAPVLLLGQATWGEVAPGHRALYRLHVEEPEQLLTLLLVGAAAADPALHVTAYDESGMAIYSANSATRGTTEAISRAAAPAGLYEIVVDGGEMGGTFFLLPRLEAPAELATQWAVATGVADRAAAAVLGAPDAASSSSGSNTLPDAVAATWSPSAQGVVSLDLTYAHPVTPHAVSIYAGGGSHAVIAVQAYNAASDSWVTLWEEAADAETEAASVRTFPLDEAEFTTDQIRLRIDTEIALPAIDAVALTGLP